MVFGWVCNKRAEGTPGFKLTERAASSVSSDVTVRRVDVIERLANSSSRRHKSSSRIFANEKEAYFENVFLLFFLWASPSQAGLVLRSCHAVQMLEMRRQSTT